MAAATLLGVLPATLLAPQASAASAPVPSADILDVDYTATGPVDHVKGRAPTTVGTPTYALDPSLNAYVGTYDGSTNTDAFDVSDAYAGTPNMANEFTAECVFKWADPFAPTYTQNLCSGRQGGGFGFFAQTGKTSITFGAYISGTQIVMPYPTAPLAAGKWYDATATFDGHYLRFYLNGNLASQVAAPGALTPPTGSSTAPPAWDLGADWAPGVLQSGSGAPVTIAASRMWSTALTGSQIIDLATRFGLDEAGPDTTAPAITVPGAVTIDQGTEFDPTAGVTASDDRDGDLTASVTVTGWPGGSPAAGVYELTYSVSDSAGNQTQAKRYVTVAKVAPVITLPGDVTVDKGSEFNPMLGVTATDDRDGDLTASVIVTGWPGDTSKAGVYELTYSVANSLGNQTQATRIVTVAKVDRSSSTPTKLSAVDATMTQGGTLALSAAIRPKGASGSVTFTIVGAQAQTLCAAVVVDSSATCDANGLTLAPGTYTGRADFFGAAAGYGRSQSDFTITVR